MDFPYQTIGVIAGTFSALGYVFYIRTLSTHAKNIRPNITSWILWTVSYILIVSSYYFSGARETIWVPFIYALANIVILFLIYKHGQFRFSTLDITLLLATVVSVAVWIIFRSPFYALVINMAIDGMATLPTALKVYKKPLSEDKRSWLFWGLAGFTNLFAIRAWTPQIALYPILATVFCIVTFAFLYRKPRNSKF